MGKEARILLAAQLFSAICSQVSVVLWRLLLTKPHLHHQTVGQKLYQTNLHPHRQAMDGYVLFGAIQVVQGGFYHVLGGIQPVEIAHRVLVGLHGVVEKLCFDPSGTDCHNPNALGL